MSGCGLPGFLGGNKLPRQRLLLYFEYSDLHIYDFDYRASWWDVNVLAVNGNSVKTEDGYYDFDSEYALPGELRIEYDDFLDAGANNRALRVEVNGKKSFPATPEHYWGDPRKPMIQMSIWYYYDDRDANGRRISYQEHVATITDFAEIGADDISLKVYYWLSEDDFKDLETFDPKNPEE